MFDLCFVFYDDKIRLLNACLWCHARGFACFVFGGVAVAAAAAVVVVVVVVM